MLNPYTCHNFSQQTAVHDAYKHAIEDGSEEWVTKMADKKMK